MHKLYVNFDVYIFFKFCCDIFSIFRFARLARGLMWYGARRVGGRDRDFEPWVLLVWNFLDRTRIGTRTRIGQGLGLGLGLFIWIYFDLD